jgi:phosphomannomutase
MLADRVEHVAQDDSAALLAKLFESGEERAKMMAELEFPASFDRMDGLRMTLADGRIVHFRPSGNAPELRCYVEADSEAAARAMLEMLMARLRSRFTDKVSA